MPDDLLIRMGLDQHTAVALKSDAFYVGAIGSRSNNSKRRARLRLFHLGDQQIARLRGPIGLHIGAQIPPEIAVSILAEMTSNATFRTGSAGARDAGNSRSDRSCGVK